MLYGREYSVSVTTTSGRLCGESPRRHALWISTPASGSITISSANPAVYGSGLTFESNTRPIVLRYG